jgi:hypothetical protein
MRQAYRGGAIDIHHINFRIAVTIRRERNLLPIVGPPRETIIRRGPHFLSFRCHHAGVNHRANDNERNDATLFQSHKYGKKQIIVHNVRATCSLLYSGENNLDIL